MANTDYQAAQVKNIGTDVEEEVVLSVGGVELTCFASNQPAKLAVGDACTVSLNLLVLGDYCVAVLDDDEEPILERQGNGFAYKIVGKLVDGCLQSCGFEFRDETLESEYEYLNGKMISIRVDRINVRFLRN